MKELILGAGNNMKKEIVTPGGTEEYQNPTTLDIDPDSNPDVVWDLNVRPLPFPANTFDEIHAYEVLEHIGRQGDWVGFFDEFTEYHRILVPGGLLVAHTPWWQGKWAWGDPGHCRVIQPEHLSFLSQRHYEQVGHTHSTDYRSIYKANFEAEYLQHKPLPGEPFEGTFYFVLKAVK